MKRLIKIFSAAIAACIMAVIFASCGGSGNAADNKPENPVTGESKILAAYFSWSGNTRQLAGWIADKTGRRIVPYSSGNRVHRRRRFRQGAERIKQRNASASRRSYRRGDYGAIRRDFRRFSDLVVRSSYACMDVPRRIRFIGENDYSVLFA